MVTPHRNSKRVAREGVIFSLCRKVYSLHQGHGLTNCKLSSGKVCSVTRKRSLRAHVRLVLQSPPGIFFKTPRDRVFLVVVL